MPSNSAANSSADPVLVRGIAGVAWVAQSHHIFDSHDLSMPNGDFSGAKKDFSLPSGKPDMVASTGVTGDRRQTATAVSTPGSRPRPTLTNSTITATATSNIPAMMKASK